LRALFLSCLSFSHPFPLFSIACSLFSRNTGVGVPPYVHNLRREDTHRSERVAQFPFAWSQAKSKRGRSDSQFPSF
jgi:hypothetical protein